ncbi:MAG TPA: DUF1345 domain-containing protein [Coleofasciculaceae cyanobacterium]
MIKLDTKPRLFVAIVGSVLIYILTPQWLQLYTRIIIAWNAGVIVFLASVFLMTSRATSEKMRSQAQRQDESRWIILIVVVVAACTSLLAIVFMLNGSKNSQPLLILHIILALFTIFASWLLIHTMFALHYAHLYYQNNHQQLEPLEFPGEKLPDYADFIYFSLGIGMTSQVADVQIASRILRRLALVHQVLSFFFNTLILALAINIMASLI